MRRPPQRGVCLYFQSDEAKKLTDAVNFGLESDF
jgi:hypothetical protein